MGIKAGTLEIEMITNLARLQSDMDQVKRSVSNMGASVDSTLRKVDTATGSVVKAFGLLRAAAAALGLAAIAGDVIRVNASFQSMEASLKIATGSVAAAGLAMEDIKKFAAETPYALEQSVAAFLKLKNLGLDPSTEALRSYGNTASSMGKDIMQMVEAVADATTGEFERLKEFGIKASVDGEKVSLTFQGVTTTIGNSAAQIEQYLINLGKVQFAGAMAAQMETLNGQWANLQDSLDQLYVAIGKLGANNALTSMLEAASTAVGFLSDNLGTILNLLGAGAIAWGVYTAATLASAGAQALLSGTLGTIMGLVATTTAQFGILAGAQVAAAAGTAGLSSAFNTLTAAMLRNPVGLVAVALGTLAAALFLSRTRTDELSGAQNNQVAIGKVLDGITANVAKQQGVLATATGKAREEALAHVQSLKAEAEKLLQVASAASIAAQAKAFAADQEAKAAARAPKGWLDLMTAGVMAGEGVDIVGDRFRKAQGAADDAAQAADRAGQAYRDVSARVAGLRQQIDAATKPIAIASSATDKLAGSTHRAAAAAKEAGEEFGKGFSQDLVGNLIQYGFEVSKSLDGLVASQEAAWEAWGKTVSDAANAGAVAMADLREENARWNDILRETVQYLDQLGGMGQALGDVGAVLFGLSTGNFSGARGPLGSMLGLISQSPDGADMIKGFTKVLDNVFGGSGSFTRTMTGVLQGAGIGAAAGSVLGNSKANQIGGMIGGALGQEAGKALGKSLGKLAGVAGPLGSIVGGILGSALGGLFKKDKYGTTTIVNGDGYGTSGNSTKNQTGANSLAQNFQQSLDRIATTLGATIGQFAVSIGVTNGKINVNPDAVTGMIGTTKQRDTIDFGEDEAGALKWAIQNAISDGALEGLSEGWKKFIVESRDIESALSKIADLKNAYDELSSLKDPQAFALEQLDKAFAELRKTATAAGDDLARVEELYGLKRKEIVEQYAKEATDLDRQARQMDAEIASLQGDAIKATTIARELEREEIDATLWARYDLIASLQDEKAALEEKAAADERMVDLQIRYARLIGDEVTARALENMQELNSARTEEERQMLRMIHETDRLMEQQNQLADARAAEADMIQAVTTAAYKAAEELRAFANEMFDEATRNDPVALMSEIQAAMLSGNTAALPELLKAYQPFAESQSGSLADYQRQIAYLRQGSLYTADYADARTDQTANAMAWISRQIEETGQSAIMPDRFYADQDYLGSIVADKLDRVAELLERANSIGADGIVETRTQTRLLDDWTNGGTEANVSVTEPVPA